MLLRRAAVALLTLAVFASPAAAAAPAPQITDECGDAGTRGEWNGDALDVEESRPHLDLASGQVAGVYDDNAALSGFSATITTCGDVSPTDGGYYLGWSYGEGCYGSVSWTMPTRQAASREGISGTANTVEGARAIVVEECYQETDSPLEDGWETIYEVALPDDAYTFAGTTLTFTVPRSLLPAQAAPRFDPGAEWANVGALTMDQGVSFWGGYGDTEGNRGRLNVRTDMALGGASYIVGEDAPL